MPARKAETKMAISKYSLKMRMIGTKDCIKGVVRQSAELVWKVSSTILYDKGMDTYYHSDPSC